MVFNLKILKNSFCDFRSTAFDFSRTEKIPRSIANRWREKKTSKQANKQTKTKPSIGNLTGTKSPILT